MHSVQVLLLIWLCVFAGADLQVGHVLWPHGQCPAQRRQTDAVCQPADALCRSILLHLHQPAALPLKLRLHGSPSPSQSSPSPIHKMNRCPVIAYHDGHSSPHSHSRTLSDAPRGSFATLGWLSFIGAYCHQPYCEDEHNLRLLSLWCSIFIFTFMKVKWILLRVY